MHKNYLQDCLQYKYLRFLVDWRPKIFCYVMFLTQVIVLSFVLVLLQHTEIG